MSIIRLLFPPAAIEIETIHKSDPWEDHYAPVEYDGARLLTDEVEIYEKQLAKQKEKV
jgi:hypothetical protein